MNSLFKSWPLEQGVAQRSAWDIYNKSESSPKNNAHICQLSRFSRDLPDFTHCEMPFLISRSGFQISPEIPILYFLCYNLWDYYSIILILYWFKFIWITVVKCVIYGPMIHVEEAFKFFVNNTWKKLSMKLHRLFLISGYIWKIVHIVFNIAPPIHNGNSEVLSQWNVKGIKKKVSNCYSVLIGK